MFLFLRNQVYYFEYFDETENRIKRVSTKCRKKNEAIKFLTTFKEKLQNKPKTNFILLNDFKKLYLENTRITCSQKYVESIEVAFTLLERDFGNVSLSKFCYSQLERFFNKTFQRTNYGAKLYLNTLRSAFQKAVQWNYFSENPLLKIKLPKIPKNNPLFVNEIELNDIINQENQQTLKDVYLFAFHTGMRLGEITNLKWSQIDFSERIISVVNTEDFTTKGKKERIIPINERLFFILSNRLPKIMDISKDVYLFNKNGFKFNEDYISKQFKKALRKTNLKPAIHFHDLRHSFASNLVMKGVPLYTVMELLGHQDIKTTQIYSHLKMDNLKDAVRVLEG